VKYNNGRHKQIPADKFNEYVNKIQFYNHNTTKEKITLDTFNGNNVLKDIDNKYNAVKKQMLKMQKK
jgi:hypothetical protein